MKTKEQLEEELAAIERELQVEQASTYRNEITSDTTSPLPADHFSLTPEWKRLRAGLPEIAPAVPSTEADTIDAPDWYAFATNLAGPVEEDTCH
jgi:hypothetical protein